MTEEFEDGCGCRLLVSYNAKAKELPFYISITEELDATPQGFCFDRKQVAELKKILGVEE